ncbi:MAG TPA: SCO family protein [Gemmatimonadales bacterium]|jgi:protein SCO1/2|nr:SCO family protein [Gemmatimonadales bacterium]
MRISLALLLLAAIAGCDRGGTPAPDPRTDPYAGLELLQAKGKPEFILTDLNGKPFDFQKETHGYVTFLFFGYTHCPDVCPLHMANLGAVMRAQPPEVANRVKVVFVTTDPERDSIPLLKAWLGRFNPDFIGLTGTVAEVQAAQQAANLLPAVKDTVNTLPGGEYSVGHAAQVLGFTADDSLRVVYPFGIRQQDWAKDVPKLVQVGR